MNLVYVIGEPGSGKTTLLRLVTAGLSPSVAILPNFRFTEWHERHGIWCLEPGSPRPGFGGTDTLGMSALPTACAWISHAPHVLVIGEGDRLAHPRFWEAAEEAGYRVSIVALIATPDTLETRRAERGSRQDPRWLRGRRTRFHHLMASRAVYPIDANGRPASVLADVLDAVPVLRR